MYVYTCTCTCTCTCIHVHVCTHPTFLGNWEGGRERGRGRERQTDRRTESWGGEAHTCKIHVHIKLIVYYVWHCTHLITSYIHVHVYCKCAILHNILFCCRHHFSFVSGTLVSMSTPTPRWTTLPRSISFPRAAVSSVISSPLGCSAMPSTTRGNPSVRTITTCSLLRRM